MDDKSIIDQVGDVFGVVLAFVKILCLILFCVLTYFVFFYSDANAGDILKPYYPGAVHQIIIDKDMMPEYQRLARMISFEAFELYGYREAADIKRLNDVGIAGEYDLMTLSTGGTGWDYDAYQKFNKMSCGWETVFYSNYDMTVIWEQCHDSSRTTSNVQLIKLSTGKVSDLYNH